MRNRLFLIILLLISLTLSGCSLKVPHFFQKTTEAVSNLPASAILTNGQEVYQSTIQMIESAQTSIYIEQDSFSQPNLKQLLIDKAHSGVAVKILLDQWQTGNKAVLEELKSENVSIQFYPTQKGQYHHAKLLVVDNAQAIIYGPSWTEESLNSPCMAVKLTEKSAWVVAYSIFLKDWKFATTLALDIPKTTTLPEDQITPAANANIKQQITQQIEKSTAQVNIEVSDLSDIDILKELTDGTDKGLGIRIILGSKASQSNSQTEIVKALRAKGIQVRYYPAPSSRQFAVFDDRALIMSSSGWTHSTFVVNHEMGLTIPSPEATTKAAAQFENDWAASSETPSVSGS